MNPAVRNCPAIPTTDMSYYSHMPVLARALAMTTGPVLELGMGWGSTPLLHTVARAQGREVHSFDNAVQWYETFVGLMHGNINHIWYTGVPYAERAEQAADRSGWAVVFIDCAPGEIRKDLALKLKDHAEFIILHDAETDGYYGKGGGGNYRYYEIDHLWKYKEVYRLLQPATLILSDARPFGLSPFEQGLST